MSTFLKRTISGIIMVLLAIFVLIQGGLWLLMVITAVSLVGAYELMRTIKLEYDCIGMIAYGFIILYNVLLYMEMTQWFMALFIGILLLLLIFYVGRYPKYTTEQIAMIFFIFLYTGVLLSYIYQVRCMENGQILVWLILISAWGSDTFAYLVGILIGKHKLPSELSPKKTIEGCIGGFFGAALIGFFVSFLYPEGAFFSLLPQVSFPLICMFGSFFS